MKKIISTLGMTFLSAVLLNAQVKGNVTIGSTVLESTEDNCQFGGAYAVADVSQENAFVTAGGKIYYRIDGTDTASSLSQKYEIKKAYVKVRPAGNDVIEFAAGKLYSYHLPGNFFQISEIYTGTSRWGKTGVGIKSEVKGFTGGIGIPLSDKYEAFDDTLGLNFAAGYDFSALESKVPLKLSGDLIFSRTKQADESHDNEYSAGISVNYAPKYKGFVSKINATGSFFYNAEPYVANSTFKIVSNYKNKDLKNSNFGSINFRANFGPVQFMLEGEAGHSKEGTMIPLYAGTQFLIPLTKTVSFKPRFFYYAALDSSDSAGSYTTYEVYPRLWAVYKNWTFSAGYDFSFVQDEEKEWDYQWKIPLFVEYKFSK